MKKIKNFIQNDEGIETIEFIALVAVATVLIIIIVNIGSRMQQTGSKASKQLSSKMTAVDGLLDKG